MVTPSNIAYPMSRWNYAKFRQFSSRVKEAKLRRAGFFGTHAPRDKEFQPEMPERAHAGERVALVRPDRCC
jgi:hypothetical protein